MQTRGLTIQTVDRSMHYIAIHGTMTCTARSNTEINVVYPDVSSNSSQFIVDRNGGKIGQLFRGHDSEFLEVTSLR